MSAPAPQRAAGNFYPAPKRTFSRTSRVIKYIFLDSCRNIPASHTPDSAGTHKGYRGSVTCQPKVKHNPSTGADCCFPLPEHHSTVFTLLKHLEEQAKDSGHFLASKKRLPVFQQLCGEVVPGMALGDVHLQNSSQELKELPDAKAPREDTKGWRMRQAAECSPCNKASIDSEIASE